MTTAGKTVSQKLAAVDPTHSVSADDVAMAVAELGIRRWNLRSCSICHEPIGYMFHQGHIAFDSNCGCTRYWSDPEPLTVDDLVETFNRQTPEVRVRLWSQFTSTSAGEAR